MMTRGGTLIIFFGQGLAPQGPEAPVLAFANCRGAAEVTKGTNGRRKMFSFGFVGGKLESKFSCPCNAE